MGTCPSGLQAYEFYREFPRVGPDTSSGPISSIRIPADTRERLYRSRTRTYPAVTQGEY